MTTQLAAHLRENWSYDGLQVTGVACDTVVATVGPSFPVSELVVDVGNPDTFDATVTLHNDMQIRITPHRSPPAKRLRPLRALLACVAAAVCLHASALLLPALGIATTIGDLGWS